MLCFLTFGFGTVVSGVGGVSESDVIGTWKFEDDESVEELTFSADHSFSAIDDEKGVLSTPPVAEQRGTWRIEEAILTIETGWVNIPNDHRIRSGTFDATTGRLVVSTFDAEKSRPFQRFDLPTCRDARAITPGPALREEVCGSWTMHYNTHDHQVRLLQNGEVTLLGFYSDEWHPLMTGQWRIDGPSLIMRVKDADSESAQYRDVTWIVTRIGTNCFVAETDDKDEHTLRRANEPNAPPPGVSPSNLSSPPPTETLSPAR
jgi:hypothetical protein